MHEPVVEPVISEKKKLKALKALLFAGIGVAETSVMNEGDRGSGTDSDLDVDDTSSFGSEIRKKNRRNHEMKNCHVLQ